MKKPREHTKFVSEKSWLESQFNTYKKVEREGYGWIKTLSQFNTLRDIFNIPTHITDEQVKDFIEEKRKRYFKEGK